MQCIIGVHVLGYCILWSLDSPLAIHAPTSVKQIKQLTTLISLNALTITMLCWCVLSEQIIKVLYSI